MWVFYLISLPLTLGMVLVTLRYFAGPDVPRYVLLTVGYTWFCSLSIIILVPADIWTTIIGRNDGGIAFFWSWSYWGTFLLTWMKYNKFFAVVRRGLTVSGGSIEVCPVNISCMMAVCPTIQSYEDAGDFTRTERLKTSIRENLVFYLTVGAIGLFGLILLIIMHRNWSGSILGLAMACSNTFGLVTGAFLLGFGLSEIPKSIWRNANWDHRQKYLSHKVAKMAVKLDNAHQDFSNAIVVAQATSNQMSRRDPLRPCMDIIDKMVQQMFQEDPSFKPSGGRLGENDMDYDTDEKSMAALRRQLRIAKEEYYRYKSEYITYVIQALELEDTIKNYEHRDLTGWKYVSSFRPSRGGTLGAFLDTMELIWRCILRKQLQKLFAIILACMSAAILLAEATLLPSGVDLSLFSILINAVGKQEMLVQIAAFVPLMYMCICTYYSLFKIGMLMFYSFTPRQTSSVSLLMICSMVARYAPPISYNFLNLIRLDGNSKTIFEKRMGNIDDAVPFFGQGFNKIYPLIMVTYTLLVASNFFGRIFSFFGSWKKFRLQTEEDNTDGLDPSGMIILQKERSWLEQGSKVGEQVIPLARNFNDSNNDVESGSNALNKALVELKPETSQQRAPKESSKYGSTRDAIVSKYAPLRDQSTRKTMMVSNEQGVSSASVSLLDSKQQSGSTSSSISSTWASVRNGFRSFKANLEAKKFLPLNQVQETTGHVRVSSTDSLDDIFHRLKQRPTNHNANFNIDDDMDDDDDISTDNSVSRAHR